MMNGAFAFKLAKRYLELENTTRKVKFIWISALLFALISLFFGVVRRYADTAFLFLKGNTPNYFFHRYLDIENPMAVSKFSSLVCLSCFFLAVCFVLLAWLLKRYTLFAIITIFGLFIGSAVLTLMGSIYNGVNDVFRKNVLGVKSHIEVLPLSGKTFLEDEGLKEKIEKIKGVKEVVGYLEEKIIIINNGKPELSKLVGVEVGPFKRVSLFPPKTHPMTSSNEEGEMDMQKKKKNPWDLLEAEVGNQKQNLFNENTTNRQDKKNTYSCIVGDRLGLDEDEGRKTIISPINTALTPMGEVPKSRVFDVVGYYYINSQRKEDKSTYTTLATAQKFFEQPKQLSGWMIWLSDYKKSKEIGKEITAVLGTGHEKYRLLDWQDRDQFLWHTMEMEKKASFFIASLVFLLSAFSIVSHGVLLVIKKRRDIAILLAMGATRLKIGKVFLYLAFMVSGIGIFIGQLFALVFGMLLRKEGHYFIPIDVLAYVNSEEPFPVLFDEVDLALICLLGFVLALFAMGYPAWMASKIKPIQGLKAS